MKPQTAIAIAAIAWVCCAPMAAQSYTFQTVGTCNGFNPFPYYMNGAGVVVGVAANGISGTGDGMIYFNGKCQTNPSVYYYGITDTGWLLASFPPNPGEYLLESGGKTLGPLPNYPGVGNALYCCMDTKTGTLAGNFNPGPGVNTAFFYKGGKFAALPWSTTGPWYTLTGFNNTGIAVGTTFNTTGFVYQKGKITSLRYPGATYTNFNGLNDNGLVVGSYGVKATGAYNICTYDVATGVWTDLNFPYPYDYMTPVGISNTGVIALLYSLSGGMVIATPTPTGN